MVPTCAPVPPASGIEPAAKAENGTQGVAGDPFAGALGDHLGPASAAPTPPVAGGKPETPASTSDPTADPATLAVVESLAAQAMQAAVPPLPDFLANLLGQLASDSVPPGQAAAGTLPTAALLWSGPGSAVPQTPGAMPGSAAASPSGVAAGTALEQMTFAAPATNPAAAAVQASPAGETQATTAAAVAPLAISVGMASGLPAPVAAGNPAIVATVNAGAAASQVPAVKPKPTGDLAPVSIPVVADEEAAPVATEVMAAMAQGSQADVRKPAIPSAADAGKKGAAVPAALAAATQPVTAAGLPVRHVAADQGDGDAVPSSVPADDPAAAMVVAPPPAPAQPTGGNARAAAEGVAAGAPAAPVVAVPQAVAAAPKPVASRKAEPSVAADAGSRVDVLQRPTASVAAQPTAPAVVSNPQPVANPLEQAVVRQVQRALVQHLPDGGERLVVRLTPPELGTVRVEIVHHGDGAITAHLMAEDEGVRRSLDRLLPSLRAEVRAADLPRVDVTLGDRSGGQADAFARPDQQGGARDQTPDQRRSADDGPVFSVDGAPETEAPRPMPPPILGGRAGTAGVDARA